MKFVRIRGRIVPIGAKGKGSAKSKPLLDKKDKHDLGMIGGAVAIAALGALAAGKLAPPGGLAGASPKMRKAVSFHLARLGGIAAIAGIGAATERAGSIAERHKKGSGVAAGGAVGTGLTYIMRSVARAGGAWRSAANFRAATKGTKFLSSFRNSLGG